MQGGFLESGRSHPIGIGVVIAAHAAVLTAIILSPPEFVREGYKNFRLIPITEPVPPPERALPKPPPSQADKRSERISKPDAVVPTDSGAGPFVAAREDPVILPPPMPSLPPFATIPDPVVVAARPDMSADAMQPPYPSALARAEIEGRAEIRILIGADGRVKQVESIAATDPGFFEATRQQALRHWRFKPATRDGIPIESWRTMTVRFQLQA